MFDRLYTLLKKERPDYVGIESVQYQNNRRGFMILSNMQGVVFSLCFLLNIPFITIEASKWRSHAGIVEGRGVGRDNLKKQAIEIIPYKYHTDASEDESESILIGQYLWDILSSKQ